MYNEMNTVEPQNSGHIGDWSLVLHREVALTQPQIYVILL